MFTYNKYVAVIINNININIYINIIVVMIINSNNYFSFHHSISLLNFLVDSPGSCKLHFHHKLGYKQHPSNADSPEQPLLAAQRGWDHPENPFDDAQISNRQVLKLSSLGKDAGWECATAGKCGNMS